MDRISVAIVEDEDQYAQILTEYLKRFEREHDVRFQVRRFHDGYEITENYPQDTAVILMDIEMGLMDGMEAARWIRARDESVEIIFVTNLASYAIQGYQVRAIDYILKPIAYIPFAESLKRALRDVENKKEMYITVASREGTEKVRVSGIRRIESHGHRISFFLEERVLESTAYSMKEIEEQLAPHGFARCSSGCLINLKYVTSFREGEVTVQGEKIGISRGKRAGFMAALTRYMNG